MVGRAGRDGEPSDTVSSRSLQMPALRGAVRTSDADDLRGVSTQPSGGTVEPDQLAPTSGSAGPRVLVGMLDAGRPGSRGVRLRRRLHVELLGCARRRDTAGSTTVLTRLRAEVGDPAAERIAFAAGTAAVTSRSPSTSGSSSSSAGVATSVIHVAKDGTGPDDPATPLPENPAGDRRAVRGAPVAGRSPQPRRHAAGVGRAPASARRSSSFGLLAAASEATVPWWDRPRNRRCATRS